MLGILPNGETILTSGLDVGYAVVPRLRGSLGESVHVQGDGDLVVVRGRGKFIVVRDDGRFLVLRGEGKLGLL